MKPPVHYALGLLAWRPGTYVFPVLYDDKTQPLLKDYLNRASNDPAQVRDWAEFWQRRTGNPPWFGIAPALSRLVFADIDTKAGKRGAQTFDILDLHYGWPDTFESCSPTGGRHLWYAGAPLFAVGRAGTSHPDIDFAQYVIVPGCVRADGTGYHVAKKRPIAAAPAWFYEVAKKTTCGAPVDQAPVVELDLPGHIAWAVHWLREDAPPSIEGRGGDDTLVRKVVPVLKDMGISLAVACELVAEHYNSKCLPPWQLGDCNDKDNLFVKVANGYRYCRQRAPGEGTALHDFADDLPEILTPEDAKWAQVERARKARRRAQELADTTVPPLLKPKEPRP